MNVAVVGAGVMGRNHIRTYSTIKGVNLCAISDINEELGIRVAKEFQVKFYKNFEEMLSKEKIELISICVQTQYHFPVALRALDYGVNILLEKPIAITAREGERILIKAKKNKFKLFVGHIERFNPAVIKLKEIIDNNELGEIIAIIARRVGGFPPATTNNSNIAIDLSIHDIDIVNFLLDDLPKQVFTNKQKNFSSKREDSVEFFLKYKKTSAYLQSNWITPVKIRKLNITGTKGYVELDYISQKIDFYKSNYRKFKRKFENFSDYILEFSEPEIINVNIVKKEPLRQEIEYIINCINKDLPVDSSFALDALRIALHK